MARILQFRKNKLAGESQENVGQELNSVKDTGIATLENVFTTSQKFWSNNSQRMQEWYKGKVRVLNNDSLKQCNHLYIKKVGDFSLAQNAALGGISLSAPSATFVWLLTHHFKKMHMEKLTDNNLTQDFSKTMSWSRSKPVNKKVTGVRTPQKPLGVNSLEKPTTISTSSTKTLFSSTQANNPKKGKKDKKGKK